MLEADRWVPVAGSPEHHQEYLDKESIKPSGHKVALWTRSEHPRERVTVWREIEFDCSARTETLLAWIRDDGGTVSHNVDRPHRAAAPIKPASVEEKIFRIVCR